METAKERIEEIKREGYTIDFSDIFNKAFENYKKIALNGGIVFILFSILMVGLLLGAVALFTGFSAFSQTLSGFKPENFTGIYILFYILGVVLITALISPFSAGILKMAHCAAQNKEFSVGTAFDYYNSSYFKELFVAAILISGFSIGINTGLEKLGIWFVGSIISYTITFFTFLTIPLIIFGNLKAIDAIQGSFLIVSKNIFVLLGLLIVSVLAIMIGLIGFCIGIFFTIPFLYSIYYCIYNHIMGIEEKSELDDIGSNWD